MELGRDLLRRAALLQETQHLDLAGGEMRRWRCPGVVGTSLEQSENADHHPFPFMSGTALISASTRLPEVETKVAVASVAGAVPSTFRENSSRARRLSSGATTEVNGDRERPPRAARLPH